MYRNKLPFCLKKKYKLFAHSRCFTDNSATLIQVPSDSIENWPEGPVKATSTTKGPGHRHLLSRVHSGVAGAKFPDRILPQLLNASCGITNVNMEWQGNTSLGLDYSSHGLQSTTHSCWLPTSFPRQLTQSAIHCLHVEDDYISFRKPFLSLRCPVLTQI